jgi:hypothetical protein
MHEFQCGHLECGSNFTASDMNHLESMIVGTPTETLMSYLKATCVTTTPANR